MFEPPAVRGRFLRQQEASIPPESLPQFSCLTHRARLSIAYLADVRIRPSGSDQDPLDLIERNLIVDPIIEHRRTG